MFKTSKRTDLRRRLAPIPFLAVAIAYFVESVKLKGAIIFIGTIGFVIAISFLPDAKKDSKNQK